MIYFWHHVRALSKREQRAAVRAAHGMGQARGDLLEHCWGGSRCFGNLGIQSRQLRALSKYGNRE